MKSDAFLATSLALALVTAGGCATEQKKVEEELSTQKEIDCATAAQDIQVLRSEKANVEQRVLEGATAICTRANRRTSWIS